MAKSIEKSVDRNGIPLSLTIRNARGTERTTRIKRSRMVRKAHNSKREPQRKEERIAAGFTRKK